MGQQVWAMEVVSNKQCGAVVGDVMEVVSMIWGSRCGSHGGSECCDVGQQVWEP